MNNIKDLLNILHQIDDDTSNSELKIVSKSLVDSKSVLDANHIIYEETADGIDIDLSIQNLFIFKDKEDCLTFYSGQLEKNILIIKDNLTYINTDENTDIYFENLIYYFKIKTLLIEKELFSHNDLLQKKFILLSEVKGKFEIGYKNKNLEFYDKSHNLKQIYKFLYSKFTNTEYISFFRNNVIEKLENIDEIQYRFIKLLEFLSNIIEKSNREFELFKNNFSFEEFHSEIRKEKEKYIKNIQENLSEFLSKVNALPVQFGVYILLVFRFQDEILPLIGTIVLIISWSAFSFFSLKTMRKTINFIERKFKYIFKKISLESGIEEEVLEQDKNEVYSKIKNINSMINWYQAIVIIFSLVFILFSISNIYKLNSEKKSEQEISYSNQNKKENVTNNIFYKYSDKEMCFKNKPI